MAARQRRHGNGRDLQPVAQQTGAAASAEPEASGQPITLDAVIEELEIQYAAVEQRVKEQMAERREKLMRRLRCTAPRRCSDHSALVKHETGLLIDDPAFKKLAGLPRVARIEGAFDAELMTWMCDAAAYLGEAAKRLNSIAATAPEAVNDHVSRYVAALRGQAKHTTWVAHSFAAGARRWNSEADATRMDYLGGAAGTVRRWVREHAPTCRREWQVVAAILVHHGWEITGTTVAHQADSLRQLVKRNAL
jgi:hypothetical protein